MQHKLVSIPEKLKAFVFEQLKGEIAELHNDPKSNG